MAGRRRLIPENPKTGTCITRQGALQPFIYVKSAPHSVATRDTEETGSTGKRGAKKDKKRMDERVTQGWPGDRGTTELRVSYLVFFGVPCSPASFSNQMAAVFV